MVVKEIVGVVSVVVPVGWKLDMVGGVVSTVGVGVGVGVITMGAVAVAEVGAAQPPTPGE